MKLRNDFVSNSSSSSFLVVLDKKLDKDSKDDIAYLKKVLYKDKDHVGDQYDSREVYETDYLCSVILKDLEFMDDDGLLKFCQEYGDDFGYCYLENETLNKTIEGWMKLAPEIANYGGWHTNDTEEQKQARFKRIHEEEKVYEENMKRFGERIYEFIKINFEGKFFYQAHFSDNDGSMYCHLEHGDTFDYVPYIRISHH